jgi:polar amino acid transport system substrate-binding protein
MEQLTQNLKDGKMELLEVPFPVLSKGRILVRNHYSLISAGTEGKTVKDARLGYIGKARARKEEVKKVIQAAKTFGIKDTYRMVMNKLDAPSSLGYSCAGEVIGLADDVIGFNIGDMVACAGPTAAHAEVVAVPVNLCVKVPGEVAMKDASFATVGAIAMQGVRQADLRLGESCAVIGLGLVGQLTIQLLKASGVKVAGIDLDENMIALAHKNGCDLSMNRNQEHLEQQISHFTSGHGVDAVIITAGSSSTDPVDLAGAIARKKGKVVIVGGVPTGFKRPNYFKKELDLRMSSSYGPGRYDPEYEEHGHDYPYGYVRWTENRNMLSFLELIDQGRISLNNIITHEFDFSNAPAAYEIVVNRSETFSGIVLKYDISKDLKDSVSLPAEKTYAPDEPSIGLIGAGSFGQNFLLPALKDKARMVTVVTARPNNAVNIARKFGFENADGDAGRVFSNQEINTVFIATRHDSHGSLVIDSLKNGKNIFVEKPLCLRSDELPEIVEAYTKGNTKLMVGYNRRFSPFTERMMQSLPSDLPKVINYRINAGYIPPDHWAHDPIVGGGRIIGEVCHFIDLAMFISGSNINFVSARSVEPKNHPDDTLVINASFEDGSIATITYVSNGHKSMSKEYLEVFCGGVAYKIDDFRSLNVYAEKPQQMKGTQDKGHNKEISAFIDSIRTGGQAPIPFNDLVTTSHATFCILESIRNNGENIAVKAEDLFKNRTELN